MTRDSTKHGPRLDDELRRETDSLQRGAPVEARADEGRLKEDEEIESRPGAEGVEARTELARYLLPSSFPGTRDAIVAGAEQEAAPEEVLELLRRLPERIEFRTMHEVWVAITQPELADGGGERLREAAARDPLSDADG